MDFEEFIKPELLILIPVLYVVGMGLKKSKISDALIPLLLGGGGILLSMLWMFASTDFFAPRELVYALFVSTTQGVLVAGASVYCNQLYVQLKKKNEKIK